jgi:hypothetical protein
LLPFLAIEYACNLDLLGDFMMKLITKQYIVDENNRKIAVQIPIEDFEKIEQLLEDYALFHLMKDNHGTELLDQTDAETYYKQLVKND